MFYGKRINKSLKIVIDFIKVAVIAIFMDFAGKIRAGRAFLTWSQDKLAHESDLSLQGIQKIERTETQPTARTQNKIVAAFQRNGVIFSERGIEYSEYPIYFLDGETEEACYLKVLEDVSSHLKDKKNPELLISFSDDTVSPPNVNAAYRKMRADGVSMRQLIQEGNTYLMGGLDEYRYIPKQFFINRVTLVYGERIASMAGNLKRASVRVDSINAEIQRNTFNLLWSLLDKPTRNTADERF